MENNNIKDFMQISVPGDVLKEANIDTGKVLQMYAENGRIIIQNACKSDYVCDGDCESCPFCEDECDNNCERCPCSEKCEDEEITLYDFLGNLSSEEQHAALVHLSVLWAQKQGGVENAD
ncbi:MAG: AbrB/MazE/SpoVT family DNA-binding domain-containing protein [Oscillospiraceae bacterium]